MTMYIALLRGINVGGKNIIKMAELKKVMQSIGLNEVQTYIQSGNVLFKSNKTEEVLRKIIEAEIEASFRFAVNVVLRTAAEFEQILQNCPFSDEEILEAESVSDTESLYVSLFIHAPSQEKLKQLNIYKSEGEDFRTIGREMYLLFHQSIRNSKLANNLQKVDVPGTVRNWKTIKKLVALAKAADA